MEVKCPDCSNVIPNQRLLPEGFVMHGVEIKGDTLHACICTECGANYYLELRDGFPIYAGRKRPDGYGSKKMRFPA